jgi:serine protease Do
MVRASRRLLRHRDFQVVLTLVLCAGAGLAAWTYHLNRQVALLQRALAAAEAERQTFVGRVEGERRRAEANREALESHVDQARRREEELRQRLAAAADGSEVRALDAELREVRSRLVAIEGEGAVGERIIREYGAGVCLILSSYAFYDAQGQPLRYRVDKSGGKVREADGSVAVGLEGDGPIHSMEAFGTGFLADRRGFVVTNRHVVEPWWKNETADSLTRSGFVPRLVTLRAFFPRIEEALKLEVRRVSREVDLAVLTVDLRGRKIPVLPLDASGRGAVPGQPVVIVGYPTGLEAILAKAESGVVQQVLSAHGTSNDLITEALARRGLIRPSTTQGHIGDVTSTDIVFDAATTQGGSGGPVFNKYGRVVGVEYAMLPQFAGNSYGLPARLVIDLFKPAPR